MAGVILRGSPYNDPYTQNYGNTHLDIEQRAADDDKRAAGYEYDPVTKQWVRSPTAQGTRQADYLKAVIGGIPGSGSSLPGGLGGTGSGGGSLSGLYSASGVAPGAQVPGIGPIDNTAANTAAFTQAKDQAGKIGRSSLESLRGLLGETGQLGGGAEASATRQLVQDAAGGLRNVRNEQAITGSNQALDIAKTNQAAGITQRGQDINAQEAAARLALEQNQLAWQRYQSMLAMALTGLTNVNTPTAEVGVKNSSSSGGTNTSLY